MIAMGDPANSADAIQRVLFIASKVHVYQVPPLTSNKGHTAATWTENEPIFTARLRIVESADSASDREGQKANLSTSIRLEDPSSGELFAAAPYTHPSAVAHCVDSSRFFAVRVVGDGGMKATLGIGFEERPEAFDFGVALQDARKILGLDDGPSTASSKGARKAEDKPEPKKDYSLKEGETITVNIGGKPGGLTGQDDSATNNASISAVPFLPPPPSADEVKMNMANIGKQSTTHSTQKQTSQDLGFDDGEFGEFQ
ncbi:MAG: hypothetical protein M1831_002736 [Alyxoria varia]|nr:MAG: hypothetical protein M1831_002736 [Alyxoria varia]